MMTGLVLKGCRGVKMDWLVIRWGLDNIDVCQVHVRDEMGWGGGHTSRGREEKLGGTQKRCGGKEIQNNHLCKTLQATHKTAHCLQVQGDQTSLCKIFIIYLSFDLFLT